MRNRRFVVSMTSGEREKKIASIFHFFLEFWNVMWQNKNCYHTPDLTRGKKANEMADRFSDWPVCFYFLAYALHVVPYIDFVTGLSDSSR